jgi:hypothetical protein
MLEDDHPPSPADPRISIRERTARLLARIPRSVFVTLLGIALTAWLLPAFTRQWDDRQKARELKAAVIAQIAAATAAQAVETKKVSARRLYLTGNGPSESAYECLNDLWLLHSMSIEARLRAYFPNDIVSRWHDFDTTMANLSSMAFVGLNPGDAKSLSGSLGVPPGRLARDLSELDRSQFESVTAAVFGDIVNGVLTKQNAMTTAILNAHVAGYSTSGGDLLHDLVP